MFYEKELSFFKKLTEKLKLNTTIITEKQIPDNIDMGIRKLLNLEEDYYKLFNTSIITDGVNEIIKTEDAFLCNYVFVPLPDCECKTVLILGPYTKNVITKTEIEEKYKTQTLPSYIISQLEKYYSALTYFADDYAITSIISSFGEVIFHSLENFEIKSKSVDEPPEISLLSKINFTEKNEDATLAIQIMEQRYAAENDLITAVSQGLTHKASMIFGSISPSGALEARLPDNLRNMKNYLIICNTLLRKAAEQGSVHPIYIDSVSSEFAIKIETIQTPKDFDKMFNYMIQKYCRLVNKHSQKNYSLLIQKVVTRIDADITADLTLKSIAQNQQVNPSYLSALFKKETGVTLTDYVNRKRIDRAKHLLQSTNLQIQTIAQSCGMLDVNYFTKVFKKHTGETPKEYRAKQAK